MIALTLIPLIYVILDTTVEINFPRRPYAVHFPLTSRLLDNDNQENGSPVSSSILQHPLLSRQTGTESRAAGSRQSRNRGTRNERLGQRHNHQTHTLHIHNAQATGRVSGFSHRLTPIQVHPPPPRVFHQFQKIRVIKIAASFLDLLVTMRFCRRFLIIHNNDCKLLCQFEL